MRHPAWPSSIPDLSRWFAICLRPANAPAASHIKSDCFDIALISRVGILVAGSCVSLADGIAFHRFSALTNGLNPDGANPAAGLALSGGVLCGTTLNGGSQGAGTAFWITLDGTNFSTFRTFTNAPDAGNPAGNLAVLGNSFF